MKLTTLTKAGGCAAKLGPRELSQALKSLPAFPAPEVLVGYEDADDAGVYQLTPDLALVQTVDYFTPIVDDPYTYGQIAAANAVSDVYAMGGIPKTALSIVGFPAKGVDFSILGDIMRGGLDKLHEAGVSLLGGHSVKDDEIKFGYAVTGIVETANIKQNAGAQSGDRIFLTKPLGAGLITTALKNNGAAAEHVEMAIKVMTTLNRAAAQIAIDNKVHTMTDVTGFGLLGHALEVARASNVRISFDHSRLPVLPGAREYSERGYCSGGLQSNREFCADAVELADSVTAVDRNLLFDPQTSGGLLVFCAAAHADALREAFEKESICSAEIGVTQPRRNSHWIEVH
jgi:selenide,water dikinase